MDTRSSLVIHALVQFILSAEVDADQSIVTRRLGVKQCLDLSLQTVSIENMKYNPDQLLCQLPVPDMCRCIRNTHSSKCSPPCAVRERCLTSRIKGHICAPTGIATTLSATTNTVDKYSSKCLFEPDFCYLSHVAGRCCSPSQQDKCFNVVTRHVSYNRTTYNAIIRVKIVKYEAVNYKRILTISSGMNNTNGSGSFTNACSLFQKDTTIFLTGRYGFSPLPMLRKGHGEELDIGISVDPLWSRIHCFVLTINDKHMNLNTSTFSMFDFVFNPLLARIWFNCDEPGIEFVCIRTCEDTKRLSKHFHKIRKYHFTSQIALV